MKVCLILGIVIVLIFTPAVLRAGDDTIVVISLVKPNEKITAGMLKGIYLKKKVFWKDEMRIIPVNLSPQNEIRNIFSKKILSMEHRELVEYWNEQYFKGITPPPVLESEEAVKRFVIEVDGAIGYIRKKNLEPGLEVLYTIEVEK
ncbi:MAG: hypothetical protein HZC45_04145 [Deltaproteobacteria bacterium]|nr:hypothetical protein [Deltaproteobacteria bacterium]